MVVIHSNFGRWIDEILSFALRKLFFKGQWGDGVWEIDFLWMNFWIDTNVVAHKKPTSHLHFNFYGNGELTIAWKPAAPPLADDKGEGDE